MDQNLRNTGTTGADQASTGKNSTTNAKANAGISEAVGANTNQDSASLSPNGNQGYQSGTTNQSDGR
jgi:hypothetical protein